MAVPPRHHASPSRPDPALVAGIGSPADGAIVTALVIRGRRHRYLLVGWLWFLGNSAPMIGLVQVDVQAMADRYAYVSFLDLFIMVCWGVADWAQSRHLPAVALPAVSVTILLALTAVTHRQITYWGDDLTLCKVSAQISPDRNWKGNYFLGIALQKHGQNEEAVRHFFRAEALFPADPDINLSLAIYEQQQNNLTVAIDYYKKVVANSRNVRLQTQVLATMAHLYAQMGDLESARQCLNLASHSAHAKAVDWQGEWWKQIRPQIQAWWDRHFAASGH